MTLVSRDEHVIKLREHAESVITLDLETARALAAHPKAGISVTPHPDGWAVRPSSTVGVISVNGRDVLIRPKIDISNVMNLLDVNTKSLAWSDDRFDYGTDDNILVALVRLFRRSLDAAVSQGIRHDYVERSDRLIALRGRIDIGEVVRRPGLPSPLPCRYDEYTADIELNCLLLVATMVALRQRHVPDADRLALRRHLARFEGVTPQAADPSWVESWEPTRLEQHYESAIRAAALLVRGTSPADRVGSRTVSQFTVNMDTLVEDFITQRILRELPKELSGTTQRKLRFGSEGGHWIYPDLTILRSDTPALVLDVKYKAVESIAGASTSDLYQLHTYAQLLGLKRGIIVSCVASDALVSALRSMTVDETGVTIELWPIDLRGSPAELDQQISMIVSRIVESLTTDRFKAA